MRKPTFTVRRDYGAQELKRVYPKNLMRGLRYSLLVNMLLLSMYWGVVYVQPKEKARSVEVKLTKYEVLLPPPSISDKTFGLSAYPVVSPPASLGNKHGRPVVRPGPRTDRKFKTNMPSRGLGEVRGDLPSAPGANKIDPALLLADKEDVSEGRPYDDVQAVGAGGNSDDRFPGGTLVASKDVNVPSGNARSGVGSNVHEILGGEGDNGGGQGGNADRFGSGSGAADGFSMSWLRGGTRRKLSGALPKYPAGVNVEAQISILTVVAPDGSIKSVQPAQKANTQLEDAAMKELRYWKFEPLRSSAPQIDQTCVVTFNFKLK
jgi:hypothetical protein